MAVAKQLNESTLMDINYDPRDKLIHAKKYIGNLCHDMIIICESYSYTCRK